MSDAQLRMYCLEQARGIVGAAPLGQLLDAARDIYDFLTGVEDEVPTLH